MIKRNLGTLDRVLRLVVAVVLLALVLVGPQIEWGCLGLIPLLTGGLGFCPADGPWGLSICRVGG